MNQEHDGGPAFPCEQGPHLIRGISKRELFTAVALHGMLSNPERDYDFDGAAYDASKYADAMITQIKKGEKS